MGRDQLVQRIPPPFTGRPADQAIGTGGSGVEGRLRHLLQETVQGLPIALLVGTGGHHAELQLRGGDGRDQHLPHIDADVGDEQVTRR
jgi:hypothetical protein